MSDSPVIAFLNKATDLILLNILWIICCLPVITAGAATTALYYVSITSIRCGDGYVIRRFFESFKKNFRQVTPVYLVILFAAAVFVIDILFWLGQGGTIGKVMFIVSVAMALILFTIVLWIFPVFAKLEGKTWNLIRNAVAFAIGYFPYTAIILVITGIVLYANYVSIVANGIMLFIGFALLAYVQSFFFYRVFMNHIDEKYDDFFEPPPDE